MARCLEVGKVSHQERRTLGMNQDLSRELQWQEIRLQMWRWELSQVLH